MTMIEFTRDEAVEWLRPKGLGALIGRDLL